MATNDIRDTLDGAPPEHLLHFPQGPLHMDTTTLEHICDCTHTYARPAHKCRTPCAFSGALCTLRAVPYESQPR
ncbi:hypothetical protein AZE42_06957 [Rhizopogon vesiculosus]|uniref:Uncharacterized protein n=1 Tax=Rhizopogon vesiculosus TaxID=180088 RepID=A0A1J8PHC0_9AGAM|nr:hypothetical protein AZE42_06957 [Rhizopogon vesiculosus]